MRSTLNNLGVSRWSPQPLVDAVSHPENLHNPPHHIDDPIVTVTSDANGTETTATAGSVEESRTLALCWDAQEFGSTLRKAT